MLLCSLSLSCVHADPYIIYCLIIIGYFVFLVSGKLPELLQIQFSIFTKKG